MHQQPRATEQPLALKIVSKSDQRSGVRGATVSFMGLFDLATSSRKLAYDLPVGQVSLCHRLVVTGHATAVSRKTCPACRES